MNDIKHKINNKLQVILATKDKKKIERRVFEIVDLLEQLDLSCPHCGTTEMLCGHNGVGCTSEK